MNELTSSEMQQMSGGGGRVGGVLRQRDGDLSMCGGGGKVGGGMDLCGGKVGGGMDVCGGPKGGVD